ncbi:MAG TPA: hypothetical protein VHP83_02110 [Aggregatilineaceae bacterium]|nr:hypothetical protein [Aggregatilineaceae bacterium]
MKRLVASIAVCVLVIAVHGISLNQQSQNNPDFTFAIRFQTPLVPDDDIVYVLPDYGDSESDISRFVSEIGDDYVCFDVLGGSARFIQCTPFSNIVSVRSFVP